MATNINEVTDKTESFCKYLNSPTANNLNKTVTNIELEEVPEIETREIQEAKENLKNNRAPEEDKIIPE